ncbi:hypothetical protein, conserved [Angomonas deanei]|uniref:Ubiquitin-like protease family profile domain-containing protein n=1 Tax=Angomonas deanei TaxID=59799 RepID=A0A7G2CUB9_9TRYP|nr:hypothetical protein, conserved [Angomonas deanei]
MEMMDDDEVTSYKCHTFVSLEQYWTAIQTECQRKVVFLPIYVKNHWIAGILERQTLEVYDSAPARHLHKVLEEKLWALWPELQIVYMPCTRQERGSNDCGLYMLTAFFSVFLRIQTVVDPKSVPSRLRPLLHHCYLNRGTVKDRPKETKRLLDTVRGILTTKHTPSLEGGAEPGDNELWTYYSTQYRRLNKVFQGNPTLRTLFVAIALIAIGEGKKRLTEHTNLSSQSAKRRLAPQTMQDLAEVLQKYRIRVYLVGQTSRRREATVGFIGRRPASVEGLYMVQTDPDLGGLPGEWKGEGNENAMFVVGATFHSSSSGTTRPHYALTQDPTNAVLGLYRRGSATRFKLMEEEETPVTQPRPRVQPESQTMVLEEEESEMEELDASDNAGTFLRGVDMTPKNMSGRQDGLGRTLWGSVCPRNWVFTTTQNPLYSKSISAEEQKLHLQWLRRIQYMPQDMLSWPVEDVLLSMLQRDAVARNYTWTTFVRKLFCIQSALKNLPLYTTEDASVDLKGPKWKAVVHLAKRMQQQADVHPPSAIRLEQFHAIYRLLQHKSPLTALYLMVMFCTAGRAVDVERLKVKDVKVGYTPGQQAETTLELRQCLMRMGSQGMTPITVVMKRGKGAYFRGTYTVHTCLPAVDASNLQSLCSQRRHGQRLFPHIEARRKEALTAIQMVEPGASMPSIRKSAVRFMAAQGMSQEEMMRITGHTRETTYFRYLGDGRHPTKEAVRLQGRAAVALRNLRTRTS